MECSWTETVSCMSAIAKRTASACSAEPDLGQDNSQLPPVAWHTEGLVENQRHGCGSSRDRNGSTRCQDMHARDGIFCRDSLLAVDRKGYRASGGLFGNIEDCPDRKRRSGSF